MTQANSSFPRSHGSHRMQDSNPALPVSASLAVIQAPAAFFRPIVQKKTFKPPFVVSSCNSHAVCVLRDNAVVRHWCGTLLAFVNWDIGALVANPALPVLTSLAGIAMKQSHAVAL